MKKVFYIALTAIGIILSSTSCEREKLIYNLDNNETSGLTGMLDLTNFKAVPNDDVVETAEPKSLIKAVNTQNFIVKIYKVNGDNETLVHRWKYFEIPHEIIVLPVGDYKIKIFSHEKVEAAAWETPYYYAEKEFTIEENKVTNDLKTIVCELQNIKVTVSYTDDLKSFMSENCQVVVMIGEGELIFGKNEKQAGYFRADNESNQLIAVFTGDIEGREEVNRIQVDNVKAGEWRKITYDIKRVEPGNETGGITPSVTVKSECDIIEINESIILEEDIIVDPDPITPNPPSSSDAPQITSETVQLGTPVIITDGLQVRVDITSSDVNGLTGLVVDIDSPTLTSEELEGMGLSAHLDLVNPGQLKEAIESLGFPTGNNVLNQSKVTFDISDFMPLLGILGPGTHNFKIIATDALDTTQQSLILVTQ